MVFHLVPTLQTSKFHKQWRYPKEKNKIKILYFIRHYDSLWTIYTKWNTLANLLSKKEKLRFIFGDYIKSGLKNNFTPAFLHLHIFYSTKRSRLGSLAWIFQCPSGKSIFIAIRLHFLILWSIFFVNPQYDCKFSGMVSYTSHHRRWAESLEKIWWSLISQLQS